jgi:GTP-binding protein
LVNEVRAAQPAVERTRIVLRPRAVDDQGFEVTAEQDGSHTRYRVLGARPLRWVQQTDFTNDEAIGYLADRLARLGVEEALLAAGAHAGAEVVIGPGEDGVLFDWQPMLISLDEGISGPRGTDRRIGQTGRVSRIQRREELERRRQAKTDARQELADQRAAGLWTDPAAEGETIAATPAVSGAGE